VERKRRAKLTSEELDLLLPSVPITIEPWIQPLRNYERIGHDAMLANHRIARFG
jgi:hypothetical protein